MFWIWFLLACVVICLPVACIKKYVKTSNSCYMIYAILLYALLAFLYMNLLENNDVTFVYALLNTVSILTVSLIGVLYFEEKIDKYKILGILLSIISIFLLFM